MFVDQFLEADESSCLQRPVGIEAIFYFDEKLFSQHFETISILIEIVSFKEGGGGNYGGNYSWFFTIHLQVA